MTPWAFASISRGQVCIARFKVRNESWPNRCSLDIENVLNAIKRRTKNSVRFFFAKQFIVLPLGRGRSLDDVGHRSRAHFQLSSPIGALARLVTYRYLISYLVCGLRSLPRLTPCFFEAAQAGLPAGPGLPKSMMKSWRRR